MKKTPLSKQLPKVSIIMNCFNGERYLNEAIDSVIKQTYPHWELIFWDNCSTDDSAKIFNAYDDERLKYICSDTFTSLGQARANAWAYVTGEYVAVLDVDDVWMPQKLASQLPLFNDPEVGLVISDTFWFNDQKQRRLYAKGYPKEGYVFPDLLANYFVSLQTLVCRKAFVDRLAIPSFVPEFSMIADFDLVMRLSRISKLALVKEPLAKWRIHGDNLTCSLSGAFYSEKCRWLKKYEDELNFFTGYEAALATFKRITLRSECIRLISCGDKKQAFSMLKKSMVLDHWYGVCLMFIVMPFSRHLIYWIRLLQGRAFF